ncbi:hypothetical protein [Bradyrhizobium sp. CCBAU 11357]|uniref:hypothetical protein n=1 Tax=Bradyrhizobium sp. CCBAU 11357 TaxID=1630808 RepID=UPI002303B9CC|nr:hypothetical protein [Bradyrhizobium sp. CCBAU 11357]
MPSPMSAVARACPAIRILQGLIAVALIAMASPSTAGQWRYGCRGVLPSDDAPVVVFSRSSLVILPKAWLNGPLLTAVNDDLQIAKFEAIDINSGLDKKMEFKREGEPEEKLTLTEISSKTTSDVYRPPGRLPRSEETTQYRKVFRWVGNGAFAGPYEIKMDCINYELSAPQR